MSPELEARDFSAGTVEQAIDKACDYYNVVKDNLLYEVTKSSTRGILRSKKTVTINARPLKSQKEKKKLKEQVSSIPKKLAKEAVAKTNEMLKKMGMDLKAEGSSVNERFIINISGSDRMYLLNRKAETLESLQFILNKMFNRHEGFTKLLLDSNGFREEKEHQLVQLAHSTATKVKNQKRSVTIDPLNSYERRIIHMALANDNEVRTSSRGEGQMKRITISMSR